jgi:hypothetical protein
VFPVNKNRIYIYYVEEIRKSLWYSGQSYCLQFAIVRSRTQAPEVFLFVAREGVYQSVA